MKKYLKLLISYALVTLIFLLPQEIRSMDDLKQCQEEIAELKIQLREAIKREDEYKQKLGKIELGFAESLGTIEEEQRINLEILATRESTMHATINLYKSLVALPYTYGQLATYFDELKTLYTTRDYNKEGHGTATGKYTARLKRRVSIIESGWLDSYKTNLSTEIILGSYVYTSQIMDVADIIQGDLCETMALYKKVYGAPHRLWEAFSKI